MQNPTNSTPVAPGETRRRISYDLRVVEFVGTPQNLVIVESVTEPGRRFVHTTDEVEGWPVVTPAVCPTCGDDSEFCPAAR